MYTLHRRGCGVFKRKGLPERLEIEFEGGLTQKATPYAGIGLLVELGRLSGVMGVAKRCLPEKKSPKGLDQGQLVESFVVLSALGGDCIDDFAGLRLDEGLLAMLGYNFHHHRLPANGWTPFTTRACWRKGPCRVASFR